MTGYSFSTPVWNGGQWTAPVVAEVTAAARIVNGPEDQPRTAPAQWDRIERHVPVRGAASPDDPALASYWADRRKKVKPPLDRYSLRLLSRQDGLCLSAGITCSPPISHPSLPNSGNGGGCTSPARR